MAKAKAEETAVATTEPQSHLILQRPGNDLLPDFMRGETEKGTEEVAKSVTPPRIKVIQAQRSGPYAEFDPGTVILTPTNVTLSRNDEPFYFVPLFHYREWCTVNPYEMKGAIKMIRARTFDPSSEIARKSRDEQLRKSDVCPEDTMYQAQQRAQYRLTHKEYLAFIVAIVGRHDLVGMQALLAFSGGSHRDGSNLAAAIMARNAPIWGCVFEGRCPKEERTNDKGQRWFVITTGNPTSPGCPHPFVQDREEAMMLKAQHLRYKELHAANAIQTDYDEEDVAADVAAKEAVASAAEGKF
jgi:hypothetical protein